MEDIKQELPGLIKLIAFLQIVAGILGIIKLANFINGDVYINLPMFLRISISAVIFIFSIIAFCVGYGLYKRKNWARIVLIVMYVLVIISSVSQFATNHYMSRVWAILVGILMINYFLTNKKVKEIFLKNYEQ